MPNGYVFQIGGPLPFWAAKRYLVNEMQKAAIIDCLRSNRRRAIKSILGYLLTVFLLLIVAPIAVLAFHIQSGGALVVLFLIPAIVSAVLFLAVPGIRDMWKFYTLLSTMPRTAQRITLRESSELHAKAAPSWLLLVQTIFYGSLSLYVTSIAIESFSNATSLRRYVELVVAVAFGVSAIWSGYLLVLKSKLKRGKS